MTASAINFRVTAGFVTDASLGASTSAYASAPEETYLLDTETSVTRDGVTMTLGNVGGVDGRERADAGTGSGFDPEFSGFLLEDNVGTHSMTVTITLPLGPGNYDIRAAFGDPDNAARAWFIFQDNGVAFQTIGPAASGGGEFIDASGANRTSPSDWKANNVAVNHTFTSSTFQIVIGATSSDSGSCCFNHVNFALTGSPPPTDILMGQCSL